MDIPSTELTNLFILFLCLIGSAFFSASETAITSVSHLKAKHLLESRGKSVRQLEFWLTEPDRVLTTLLIGNNAINIFASALATDMASRHFHSNAIGIATGATTFMVLVFGEIVPKSFARANSEPLALIALKIIYALYRLFYPVVVALAWIARTIIHSFGSNQKLQSPSMTEEELEFLINEGESSGVLHDFKKNMISGVFEFDETKVSEIMTPRPDVIAIERNATLDDGVALTIQTGHSRIPVYGDRIDNVVGILLAKDLLRTLSSQGDSKAKVSTLMREPFFTPESKPIMDVFKDLKRTKNHMTVVIDEYGGTAGIVTMEDILEEIVGDIQDEFDVEEAQILEIDQNVYDVSGSMNIDEFKDFFQLNEEHEQEDADSVDTVAGWMIQMVGDLPRVGQAVNVGPLQIEVTEVGRHRIERVRVTKSEPTPSPEIPAQA